MFVPQTTVQLLTSTSKMPCDSWSLPAVKACPGAFFGEGAICGETRTGKHSCYATKGAYAWKPIQNAQKVRYDWLLNCLTTDDGLDEFVGVMVKAIGGRRKNTAIFRVHDSGDLFNARYIEAWYRIVSALPTITFWFPTRSWRLPNLLPHLVRLNSLPNAVVRPSALKFGDMPPVIEGLSAGTSASKVEYNCPAHAQDNECRDCRKCWTKDKAVVYRQH